MVSNKYICQVKNLWGVNRRFRNQDETKEVGRLFGDLFNLVFNIELRFFKADSKTMRGFDTIFESEKSICVENFKIIFVPESWEVGDLFNLLI